VKEVHDLPAPAEPVVRPGRRLLHTAGGLSLTLAALGVVFGDIGTSPLYALQTVFALNNGAVEPTSRDVYGVISLVFWAITIVVSFKYVTFILRADNDGEGGIMALIALVKRLWGDKAMHSVALVVLGVFGAALFYGDSIITPSISVLSAVEGLNVAAPSLSHLVVPIAVTILALLFAIQRFGTHRVGNLFGPVMAIWFLTLAALGLHRFLPHPAIIRSLSPTYAFSFAAHDPYIAFLAIGAVVLAITGAEALYADMGHFGRPPIRRAWFLLVFPALTFCYLGQGALILHDPKAISNPFFLLAPDWAQVPLVVLATAATVIASQAVISGAFSVSRQASQLGFLPRLQIRHTSEEAGQVYAPAINWTLFACVLILIAVFRSSAKLAHAYGVAVTGTFIIDTILFLVVARYVLRWRRRQIVPAGILFLTVDVCFFAGNVSKVLHGGWFPLLIAFVVFALMMTWQRGRVIVTDNRVAKEGPLQDYIHELHRLDPPVQRTAGTAVFLHPTKETTPLALRANVEHNHVLHETVIIVSVRTENVPHVPDSERLVIDDLGYADDGIVHITIRFGFQDVPDVPAVLRTLTDEEHGGHCDVDEASFFLSKINLRVTRNPGMNLLRKKLFVRIASQAANPAEYFNLPDERTVVMGAHINV
jgi:KUP system potassium uptake protein